MKLEPCITVYNDLFENYILKNCFCLNIFIPKDLD